MENKISILTEKANKIITDFSLKLNLTIENTIKLLIQEGFVNPFDIINPYTKVDIRCNTVKICTTFHIMIVTNVYLQLFGVIALSLFKFLLISGHNYQNVNII